MSMSDSKPEQLDHPGVAFVLGVLGATSVGLVLMQSPHAVLFWLGVFLSLGASLITLKRFGRDFIAAAQLRSFCVVDSSLWVVFACFVVEVLVIPYAICDRYWPLPGNTELKQQVSIVTAQIRDFETSYIKRSEEIADSVSQGPLDQESVIRRETEEIRQERELDFNTARDFRVEFRYRAKPLCDEMKKRLAIDDRQWQGGLCFAWFTVPDGNGISSYSAVANYMDDLAARLR